MTENIVTGRVFRVLSNSTQNIWDRISFWKKASDVEFTDGTTLESNKPFNVLKRDSVYSVGDIAYELTAPSWVRLRCTTAGTTSASLPSTYSTISSVGVVITDGTAKFIVYDVRPTTNFSTSNYVVPSVSLVNTLDSQLIANGYHFYFDYQGGKYGFNTSSSRPASSFVPFS